MGYFFFTVQSRFYRKSRKMVEGDFGKEGRECLCSLGNFKSRECWKEKDVSDKMMFFS